MDNEDSKGLNNSNRILLALLVTFLGTPLILLIGEKIGLSNLLYNPKLVIGLAIGLAILADRIYIYRQKNKNT